MKCCYCNNRNDCSVLAVVASIIIGIITAFLRFSAIITVTPAFLWVVLGIAVGFLALTFLITTHCGRCRDNECFCSGLPVLITGILGSVVTSIVLLAIEFAATSVAGAIITGALLAFLFLIFTSVACISICAADCAKNHDDC